MARLCEVWGRRERKHCRQEHFDVWNVWVLNLVSRIEGGTYAEGGLGMGFQGRYLGPRRDDVTGEWSSLLSEYLHDLYSSANIIRVIYKEE
jgi:hypothetical protein